MPNWPRTRQNVVLDAGSLVGALLKAGSTPEQALLIARAQAAIFLSQAVEAEVREVFSRRKFAPYAASGRVERILKVLTVEAVMIEPVEAVTDCRDRGDNKYLELALAANAAVIVSSDADLLVLHPWRGIDILTPAEFVARFT